MKRLLTTALTSTFLILGSERAFAFTPYNGSLGTSPGTQGWSRPSPFGQQTVDASGTILNTNGTGSDFGIRDGYSQVSSTPLNATTGFNLRFDLQLLDEARSGTASNNTAVDNIDDRAGLSITVISADASKAIELGFWTNRIWAQEGGLVKADPNTNASPPTSPTGTRFTQAEGAAFNTQSSLNRYDLSFSGNSYFLYVNGNYSTPLLTGLLRDYRPEAAFGGVAAVYAVPNFVFVGDNTTSARGSFRLNQVEYSATAIPFAFNPLLGFGIFGLSRLRKVVFKRPQSLKG